MVGGGDDLMSTGYIESFFLANFQESRIYTS